MFGFQFYQKISPLTPSNHKNVMIYIWVLKKHDVCNISKILSLKLESWVARLTEETGQGGAAAVSWMILLPSCFFQYFICISKGFLKREWPCARVWVCVCVCVCEGGGSRHCFLVDHWKQLLFSCVKQWMIQNVHLHLFWIKDAERLLSFLCCTHCWYIFYS